MHNIELFVGLFVGTHTKLLL